MNDSRQPSHVPIHLRRFVAALSMALVLAAVFPANISSSFWRAPADFVLSSPHRTPTPRPGPSPTSIRPKPVHHIAPLTAATTVLAFPGPPIAARAAYLMDMSTGKELFSQNPDTPLPMASTTKIMTATVVLQHARLSDMVTASNNAATIGESTMSLRRGERLSVRDLLYGMLLNSGNDAAVALAEHVGGTQVHFVAMMNALARTLHLSHTHFATPHGLDAPNHYTSARDLATLTMYAMRDPTFRRIVASTEYHIPRTKHNAEHWLGNINKALYWYPGVDGVKPGDTDAAGLCQVVSAWRNGRHVLAVVLHTPNLATDVRNLLNMGTRDFEWVPSIFAPDAPFSTVSGGSGRHAWTYFYGAGHYVSGLFLSYFNTHGGLQTLGYPRTEELQEDGRTVQYFEGGELVYDPAHDSVYPEPVGATLANLVARPHVARVPRGPSRLFSSLLNQLGGAGVFGSPVTGAVRDNGDRVQFFQYGEFALTPNGPQLVPIGDAMLRMKRWLPAAGVGNSFPPTMAPSLSGRYVPPPLRKAPKHRTLKRHSTKHGTAGRHEPASKPTAYR